MFKKGLIVLVAVAAMTAGFWFAQNRNAPVAITVPDFQGWAVTPPRQINVPELISDEGTEFGLQDISGQWSLLFFGYTSCPDVCPTTLNVLAQAKKQAQGIFPQVVFVSVDPQRDTVEMLGDYVRYFDPDFRGVTGSSTSLKALSMQASVVYMRMPAGADDENYLVEHSSSILLFNPEGKLHAFLSAPHTPNSILNSLQKIYLE